MHLSPAWISGILWFAFILYWSAAASNSAPAVSTESSASRQFHQLLLWGALILAFGVRVPPLNRRWLPESPVFVPAGLMLQAGSALLAVWARRHLGRNWSGAIATKEDHRLIRTGPYRAVRHPIYSGMLGMFLGTAVVLGAFHALAAFGMILLAYVRKIRLEEIRLREIFGTEYETYQRESRALIPGLF